MKLVLKGNPAEIALFLKNLNEKVVTLNPHISALADIKPPLRAFSKREIERLPHLPDVNTGNGKS